MEKYVKKPIEIEAMMWDGKNHRGMWDFLTGKTKELMTTYTDDFYIDFDMVEGGLVIQTSEGDMIANIGDYIIKEPFDKDRKFYPCKPDIFKMTYGKIF